MTDELFDFGDDVYINSLQRRQKKETDTIKLYITALRRAYTELQNEYKDKIEGPARVVFPPQPTLYLNEEMVCTAEKNITIGEIGDLHDLSYVQNANESNYGKDFYHHCPEAQDGLVRLTFSQSKGKRMCPLCDQMFESK